MKNSEFLRRQAEACIVLSRATFDLTLAGRLRAMATELRVRATTEDENEFPRWSGPAPTSKIKPGRN